MTCFLKDLGSFMILRNWFILMILDLQLGEVRIHLLEFADDLVVAIEE